MVDQLRPHPTGPYASQVNVLELNRILRDLQGRLDRLEGTTATQASSVTQIVTNIITSTPTVTIDTYALTGVAQNNFPLGATTTIARFVPSITTTISGFVQSTNGREVTVWNANTANQVRLLHDDSGSDANNRILCEGSANIFLSPNFGARLWYDQAVGRWRAVAL